MMKKLLLSLGLGLLASFGATAQSTEDAITNIVLDEVYTSGTKGSITFDYEYSAETPGAFLILMGQTDAIQESYYNWGDAGNGWADDAMITQTSSPTTITIEFDVPLGLTSTEEATTLGDALKIAIRMKDCQTSACNDGILTKWVVANVAAAANSGVINNVNTPATAELGATFTGILNYTHDFPEAQTANVTLVNATIGGDLLWSKTVGFKALSLPAGDQVDFEFQFEVKTSEAVLSSALPEGQEWRFVVQFLGKDLGTKLISIVPSAQPINLIENVMLDVAGSKDAYVGSDIDVSFKYQLEQDAIFEISVVKFAADGSTVAAPEVIATTVVYSDNILASTEVINTASAVYKINVLPGTVPSASLTNGQKYQLVVKILEGNTTTNTYTTQFNFPINILDVTDGLFTSASIASYTTFPNPTSTQINFSKEVTNVTVLDAQGNVVETAEKASNLNTSSYQAGMYLIKTDQGASKIVVE